MIFLFYFPNKLAFIVIKKHLRHSDCYKTKGNLSLLLLLSTSSMFRKPVIFL